MKLSAIGAALFLILAFATLAPATVSLELSTGPDGYGDCEIADPGPNGWVTIYVLARYAANVNGLRFAAPVPTNSGLTHVSDVSGYTMTGNSQSGMSLGLGICESGTFSLLQMYFLRTSAGDPCTFYAVQSGAIYMDCSFAEFPTGPPGDGVVLNSNGDCELAVPIHNPSPADGATGVPLTTQLSWENGYYLCNAPLAAAGPEALLYFGTSPKPPYVGFVESPHLVGPLPPATTYYWWVYSQTWPYFASPVWSFTTTTGVAARSSTWGAIKALYR